MGYTNTIMSTPHRVSADLQSLHRLRRCRHGCEGLQDVYAPTAQRIAEGFQAPLRPCPTWGCGDTHMAVPHLEYEIEPQGPDTAPNWAHRRTQNHNIGPTGEHKTTTTADPGQAHEPLSRSSPTPRRPVGSSATAAPRTGCAAVASSTPPPQPKTKTGNLCSWFTMLP